MVIQGYAILSNVWYLLYTAFIIQFFIYNKQFKKCFSSYITTGNTNYPLKFRKETETSTALATFEHAYISLKILIVELTKINRYMCLIQSLKNIYIITLRNAK